MFPNAFDSYSNGKGLYRCVYECINSLSYKNQAYTSTCSLFTRIESYIDCKYNCWWMTSVAPLYFMCWQTSITFIVDSDIVFFPLLNQLIDSILPHYHRIWFHSTFCSSQSVWRHQNFIVFTNNSTGAVILYSSVLVGPPPIIISICHLQQYHGNKNASPQDTC